MLQIQTTEFRKDGVGFGAEYTCSRSGDQTGTYVRLEDVQAMMDRLETLESLAAKIGRELEEIGVGADDITA